MLVENLPLRSGREVSRYFSLFIKDGHETGKLFDFLKNVFASKSTNTLNSRVGPMIRYVFCCKSSQKYSFPLVESVYSYMLHEESKPGVAPTYLRSFVSSLAFCHYVMGLVGAKCIVESKRVTGLAYKMYLTKPKRNRGRRSKSVRSRFWSQCLLVPMKGLGQIDVLLDVSFS